jgi:hypothetical protein
MSKPNEHVQLCAIVAETDMALCIRVKGEMHWVPWSTISTVVRPKDGPASVTMTKWIAIQKGFIENDND